MGIVGGCVGEGANVSCCGVQNSEFEIAKTS